MKVNKFDIGDEVIFEDKYETTIVGERKDDVRFVIKATDLPIRRKWYKPSYHPVEWGETIINNHDKFLYAHPCQVELISKGEDNMSVEDLEGIAVVGDDLLKQKLIEFAEETGFNTDHVPYDSPTIIFYNDKKVKHNSGRDYSNQIPDLFQDRIDKVYELPEDWDKAREFIESIGEPDFRIGDRKVEFNEDNIEIGCKKVSNEDLETFYDILSKAKNRGVYNEVTDYDTVHDIYHYQFDSVHP